MGEVVAQTALSDKVAIAALIVAVFSLAISIVGVCVQKQLNRINLEAKYYENIFDAYLLVKIPEKVSKIKFDSNYKLNRNYKELNEVMMEMVRDARYFSFSTPRFYQSLQKKTIELDEYLVSLSSKKIVQIKDQNKQILEIEAKVSKIIVFINKNYCCK